MTESPPASKPLSSPSYRVHIRDNRSRETRSYVEPRAWSDLDEYIWSEGNFACDCNRSLFFKRAGGEEDPESDDCGDGRYSVFIQAEDGATLYEDGEWPEAASEA